MKSETRALVSAAALFGLFTVGVDARADSKKECAAAYDRTQSLRESGQLRDARKQALACSASTCSAYVSKDCLQWLAEIDASLPTVVFVATDGAGADTPAVRVMVDGQTVTERLDGKAVPVDPGEHEVRFEAAGADAIEQKVMIREGEKNRTLAVSFKKAPPSPAPALSPARPPPEALAARGPDAAPKPASGGGVPVWAWISGGVGVVALGVGAGFGVSAVRAQSELVTRCGGDPTRCPEGTRAETGPLADRRNVARGLALGLGAAAVVGLGVAVVGIAGAPSSASSRQKRFVWAPFGSPFGGGLELHGRF